jgi:MoaA/NifB/PqqE/SkfB family radical SAM enzyme
LKRLGVLGVDVTGGEPLLYRNLLEMLTLAKQKRLITSVTTNGMLYPKFAERLVGKVDALLFSIDSADAEEHDRIRAMKSFHLALEALSVARKLKQPLYISHVVTNESLAKVDEMIRFANDQHAILYLNPCFSFFGNEGLAAEKATELMKYFGKPGIIIDRAQLRLIAGGGNHVNDPVCRAVSSTVVISPENKLLLPCYHFKEKAIPIENNLYALYTKAPEVQEAKRMEGRYSFCEGCSVYCYMRSSLMWRYPLDSFFLAAHYVRERARQYGKRVLAPITEPVFGPHEVSEEAERFALGAEEPARRRLPLAEQ